MCVAGEVGGGAAPQDGRDMRQRGKKRRKDRCYMNSRMEFFSVGPAAEHDHLRRFMTGRVAGGSSSSSSSGYSRRDSTINRGVAGC